MEELEEAVNDVIFAGKTQDRHLAQLIEVTADAITSGRHIFPNPLLEPVMYKHMYKWVKAGLEEAAAAKQLEQKAMQAVSSRERGTPPPLSLS